MSKFVQLSIPNVTIEQKAHLVKVKNDTGVDVNTQLRQLIQKAMDESKPDNKRSLEGLPMDIVHSLRNASLVKRTDVEFYIDHVGPIENVDGIDFKAYEIIMNWLEG